MRPGRERIAGFHEAFAEAAIDPSEALVCPQETSMDFAHGDALALLGASDRPTALIALGTAPDEARRVADAFEAHDESLLTQSYALRDDRDAYIGFVRRSTDMLDRVMRADRDAQEAPPHEDKAAE